VAELDELEAEQAYIDRAYACLDAMRKRAEELDPVGDVWSKKELELALAKRVASLKDTGRALCFGRIDEEDGPKWYIGRRHVEDAKSDPVVVEWRAPIAAPYYRARPGNPQGLVMRRQFMLDGRTIVSMADDRFDESAEVEEGPAVRGRAALMAELERSRTGEMIDIVATIQPEQDEIIRSPLEGLIAVQGGPGTGKTAVGLHRAAFLLYTHPPLSRAGVLVIGPNRTFLKYIAQVLPSLGEEAVVQTTPRDLLSNARVRREESPEAQRLKGDARMAEVIRRSLVARRRPLEEDLTLRYSIGRVTLTPDEAWKVVEAVSARRIPWNAGRTNLREQLLRALYLAYTGGALMRTADPEHMARTLRNDPLFQGALDRLWPSVSANALIGDLLSSPTRMAEAAAGLLTADEQQLILHPSGKRPSWTEADVALLDEAHELLAGQSRTYGHVIADEAQDLSPMQLRMLSRRCPSGSMTILGDLAQGTGVWANDSWDEVLAQLPQPDGARVEELRLGYRAPAQVIELASGLLPTIAPQVTPTESVRRGRTEPHIIRAVAARLAAVAAEEAIALTDDHHSVAVIVPDAMLKAVNKALHTAGLDVGEATHEGLDHRVTVLAAQSAKGLEFDAVIVVEPAAVAEELPGVRGLRLLYIAMTRPTRHLSVVHSLDLPAGLDAPLSVSA
jgi:DNA helicase IV